MDERNAGADGEDADGGIMVVVVVVVVVAVVVVVDVGYCCRRRGPCRC